MRRPLIDLLSALKGRDIQKPWILVTVDDFIINYIKSIDYFYTDKAQPLLIESILYGQKEIKMHDWDGDPTTIGFYIFRNYKINECDAFITYCYKKDHVKNMEIIASFLSKEIKSKVNYEQLINETGYGILTKKSAGVCLKSSSIFLNLEDLHRTFYKIKYITLPNK